MGLDPPLTLQRRSDFTLLKRSTLDSVVANSLTGDYEAALQIAIRQINGLLGTLHQNGATADAALQLPHSATLRIADRQQPVAGGFEDWVTKFQRAGPGRGLGDIRAQLTAAAPPGAARMLTEAFETLYENWGNILPPPGTLHGLARLQVSSAHHHRAGRIVNGDHRVREHSRGLLSGSADHRFTGAYPRRRASRL